MRPGEVLDARTDLLDRLQFNNAFRRQAAFMLASQAGDVSANYLGADRATKEKMHEAVKHRLSAIDTLANHVKVAEVYRVTSDMSALVQFAAHSLDGTDQIITGLAPSQCGVVRFDKPLPVKDIRGQTMLIHWLVWGPYYVPNLSKTCTTVWAFNDPKTDADDIHQLMLAQAQADGGQGEWYEQFVGRFATVGADFLFDGQRVGPYEQMPSPQQAAEALKDGQEPMPGTNTVRLVHALWMLLGQTVTVTEPEEVDRPARRRAGKMRLPGMVTVIRLRRESNSLGREPGESHVEWQHRWIVRGHPRWQHYGSRRHTHEHVLGDMEVVDGQVTRYCVHGGCDHEVRRIWIAPFEKGPEGAPLKQSEKVYSLER